ncbi:asparagine synthase (glutamine-hydrolyzing) [Candidatus Woesearchaeota archaeon]|nr:asparagine synthase (glutamine-hydrolyzing) [Candidatus Woesearchaeota archaeon]
MCGIFGFIGTDKQLLEKGLKTISHRGPDQHGIWSDDLVSLGHQRLSIIDLSEKGKQPMANKKGELVIVFNGEIFNFKEIRADLEKKGHRFETSTDTEVIINAYAEYGEDCVQLFNGMFAFCIYDIKRKKLFLARDRLGVKPLYYYFDNLKFLFASEIKAILEDELISKEVNDKVLSKYLAFRCVYGVETIFKGIFRVLPGEYIVYDIETRNLKKNIYWQTQFTPQTIISFEKAKERFFSLFKDSVSKRLISDVPLGVYLSGGIDSSSIVAMMRQLNKDAEIKTFSVGFGYGEETDELKYARKISEHLNTTHQEFIINYDTAKNLPKIIWHCDEPLADPALLPVYLLSQQAKKNVTVILTGDGADEILAGYEQVKFLQLRNRLGGFRNLLAPAIDKIPSSILKHVFKYAQSLGEKGKQRAKEMLLAKFNDDAYKEIVSVFDDSEQNEVLLKKPDKLFLRFDNQISLVNQILLHEQKTILPENMLMKADRMTMAWGVEERTPFLDYRLVNFVNKLPISHKLKGFNDKIILRKTMQSFLPREILNRKKQRFYVPIDKWLKNDLSRFVDQYLSKQSIADQGIFKYDYIQKIKEKFDNAPLYYARQLWTLLTFQIWHEQFIKK